LERQAEKEQLSRKNKECKGPDSLPVAKIKGKTQTNQRNITKQEKLEYLTGIPLRHRGKGTATSMKVSV
jgi:hypothetical protein